MRNIVRVLLATILGTILICGISTRGSAQMAGQKVVPAWDGLKALVGDWGSQGGTIVIKGRIYEGWLWTNNECTFDIRGWDYFSGTIGIADDLRGERGTVAIYVDDQPYYQAEVMSGQQPVQIGVPLTGHQTMRLERKNCGLAFCEPKLAKNTIPSLSFDQIQRQNGDLIQILIDMRAAAQQEGNKACVDYITNRLNILGIGLKDTPQGTSWYRK